MDLKPQQIQSIVAAVAPSVVSYLKIAHAATTKKFSSIHEVERDPWIAAFRVGYVVGVWDKWIKSRAPGSVSAASVEDVVFVSAMSTARIAFALESQERILVDHFSTIHNNTRFLPNWRRGYSVAQQDLERLWSGPTIGFAPRLGLADIYDEVRMTEYGLPPGPVPFSPPDVAASPDETTVPSEDRATQGKPGGSDDSQEIIKSVVQPT